MAEYCSQCSPFKLNGEWDIDLLQIALKLEPGRSESFLCEGCNNRAVYKDEKGLLYLGKQEGKEINLHPVAVEELMA